MPTSWTTIESLLSLCGPSTISLEVPKVIVDAVQCRLGRRFTHFGEETLEIAPFLTGENSPSAIVLVIFGIGIGASRPHLEPRDVGSAWSASAVVPVLRIAGDKFVAMGATAAGRASSEICDADGDFVSAVASAEPKRTSRHMRESNDGQSTVSSSADIFESRHDHLPSERLCLGAARCATSASSRRHSTTEASRGGA